MQRDRRKDGSTYRFSTTVRDAAEDIEKRRIEIEEEERQEKEERQNERLERDRTEGIKQMEETEDRTEKQPGTATDTDPESTQSMSKNEQMKSIFLRYSDKEAIVKLNSMRNCSTRLTQRSKTSRRRRNSGKD